MFSFGVLTKTCFTYKHYCASAKTVEEKWVEEHDHNLLVC